MVPARTAHAVLVILAVLALLLILRIMLPFATSLFLAAVLAGALSPWAARLAAALGGRRILAALLLTAAVFFAVAGPLSALGAVLVPQIQEGVAWLRHALHGRAMAELVQKVPAVLRPFAEHVQQALPSSLERLQGSITVQGARAAAMLGNLLSATGNLLFQSVLMLVALYFFLLDGPALVEWLNEAIPLKRGQVSELLREFRRVTVTVLVSTLATGGVQSVLAFAGYAIAQVPNPIFFTLVTFVLSLVPFLGATVVVVGVGVVKLVNGHTAGGIFLITYGLGAVAMVDNVVKPLFIRGSVPIHGAVIFFALFGGIAVFGPVGFLVGPLAVSFLVAVVRMYRRDYGG
ncbi:MAG TPA: AI-2E family transporter [Anaeromyxobacteraceae bacterium]|nr:AI-2E family transporter [Anaeromyxobacteraceae bacterium]